jgi:hypothetical protein
MNSTAVQTPRNAGEQSGPLVERDERGGVSVTQILRQDAPDEIRPVAAFATMWGLEPNGLLRAATRAGVLVKIGRQVCARRSDLLRMVDLLKRPQGKSAPIPAASGYDELVSRARASR